MNSPTSTAGTVPARKEYTAGTGPSPINLGRCEAGALHTIRKIDEGRPFQCIRHPEQGPATPTECINHGRHLCAECSTGRIVRARAGVPERPFFVRQEDQQVAKKIKMLDTCPGCKRPNIREHSKGYCARCCNYLAKGKPIPPLPPELQPQIQVTPEPQEARISRPDAQEQIGPLDDYPETIRVDRVVAGISEQIVAEAGQDDDRPTAGLVLDFSGFPGADELAEWLHDTAAEQFREPEAQAFYLLRQAQRITGTLAKSRDRFHKECRCSE